MSFEGWLDSQQLNVRQRDAVLAPGDLAIRAAAGSGKTKTLVCRILALLNSLRAKSAEIGGDTVNRASLSRIAATTFTRKAAGEMRERLHQYLEQLVHQDPDNQIFWNERLHELPSAFIGTIDSLAGAMVRQLNRAGCASQLGSDFTMLDELDRDAMIEEAIRTTRIHFARQPQARNGWRIWEAEDGRAGVVDGIFQVLLSGQDGTGLVPDPHGGELSVAMLDVIWRAGVEYRELCKEKGAFDFSQVSRELLRLLQTNEGPRERIGSHFEHLLVDEFQDTNDQQWQILTALAGTPGKGRLTVVGDPQQSIYMFRGADPGVFERTWTLFDRPDCQRIVLDRNYRTLAPRPMGAMNHFSQTGFQHAAGSDAAFYPLQPGLESDQPGEVALILEDNDELWCERVARELIKRASMSWYDHRTKTQKRYRFRDMAILLRSRSRLSAVQHALETWKVPYEVPGGIGFWQTQEIRDVINLVRALADDSDDLAVAGLMRGPLGRLNDSVLLALTRSDAGSLGQKLEKIASGKLPQEALNAPDEVWRALTVFAAHWADWRRHVDRMPHVDLTLRALKQSGAWHFFASMDQGARRIANLEKLMGHFHDWGMTHPGSMAQLARRMEKIAQEATKSEQAQPRDQQDAVQIMTIHAAKGLERPLVVLGDIQNAGSNHKPSCVALDRFLHFSDPESEEARKLHGSLIRSDSPTLDPLATRIESGKTGELARLFYVGLTRAQDTLILAGSHKPQSKPPKRSFLFWVAQGLGLDPEVSQPRLAFDVTAEEHHGLSLMGQAENLPAPALIPLEEPPWIADEVHAFPENPVLAMSMLEELAGLWEKNPEHWRMRFLYFVQPFLSPQIPGLLQKEASSDSIAPGKRIGSLVHRALELGISPAGMSREEGLELLGHIQMGMAEPDEDPIPARAVAEEAWELFQGEDMLADEEIRRLVEAPGLSEVDLVLPLGRWRLSGRLDKLLDEQEDGPSFVDWKTDHLPPARIEEKYETAMGLYALALSKAQATPPKQVTGRLVCLRHGAVRTLIFDKKRLAQLEKKWTGLLNQWLEDRERPKRSASADPRESTADLPKKKPVRRTKGK